MAPTGPKWPQVAPGGPLRGDMPLYTRIRLGWECVPVSPIKPLGPCTSPGCAGRATHHGRCERHARLQQQQYDRARGSSAQRGYDAAWRQRRTAYLRRHPSCVVCGAPATDVDHIVPRRQGGIDAEANLQALCHQCHSRKTALTDGRWG